MQERYRFTQSGADEIRRLLRDKARVSRSDQKSIRGKIRRLVFYITDFDSSQEGFSAADFESLIRRNLITIIEGQAPSMDNSALASESHSTN